MNPGIFLIQENGDLVEMIETPLIYEALLQTWLEKYPSLWLDIRLIRPRHDDGC
jgi:hypothetical protein